MRKLLEHLVNGAPLMPRRVVDDEHDPGVLRGRIGAGNIAEVVGQGLLQVPPFRHGRRARLPWTLHEPRGQMAGHEVQSAVEVERRMTIQVPYEGPVPLDTQRGTEGWDQGEAGFILAQ